MRNSHSRSHSDRRRHSGHDQDRRGHRRRGRYDDDYDYDYETEDDYYEDDGAEIIEPEEMSILSHILVIGQDVSTLYSSNSATLHKMF